MNIILVTLCSPDKSDQVVGSNVFVFASFAGMKACLGGCYCVSTYLTNEFEGGNVGN